jgi:hypothetical protein
VRTWTEHEALIRAMQIAFDASTGRFSASRCDAALTRAGIFCTRECTKKEISAAGKKACSYENGKLLIIRPDVFCRELNCNFLYMPTAEDVARGIS